MSVDLLMPLRALTAAALIFGTSVMAASALLLLARDLAQARFGDEKRDEG